MGKEEFTGKTVLITGAGSGIGRALTLAFAKRGADLILCDVNESAVAETAETVRTMGRKAVSRKVDVSSADEMSAFAAEVHQSVEAVDILVNNAGVAIGGFFADTSLKDWEWIMGINVWGVIHGCHFFTPPMVKRGRGGHVVNVASAAGYASTESLAAYGTTKYAVIGLSEALREELGRSGIGVTAVCPGFINTPITSTARLVGAFNTTQVRARLVGFYDKRGYTAERVAEGILKAIQKNRAVAPIAPEAWFMYYLKRFFPGLLALLSRKTADRTRRELFGR